jgi:hypothetical protein
MLRRARFALVVATAVGFAPVALVACPFCTALRPTLAQQRESAVVVAIGEVEGADGAGARIRVQQTLSGGEKFAGGAIVAKADAAVKAGSLGLLFGNAPEASPDKAAELQWSFVPASETLLAYFAAAPPLRAKAAERLAYYDRYLEHADAAIAEDAYQEFAHAKLEDIAPLAEKLPFEKFRGWLVDKNVPQTRKGFYGVALGLAKDDAARRDNVKLLERMIETPSTDFRAGFDGVLGAYLLLRGGEAVDLIEKRYLADPKSAEGDVRHAVSALRFYWEYGHEAPATRLRSAMRRLLARKEFRAAAIVDLARWEDWDATGQIAPLYDADGGPLAVRQAVVGYLAASPKSDAAAALAELRRRDPAGVAAAERQINLTGTAKQ